jgi:hypothetical protein
MYQSVDQRVSIPAQTSISPPRSSSDADQISPFQADFTLKERPLAVTLHPFRSQSQPATRSSSPKPPVPTAPKPVFDRSSLKTSPRLRQHESDMQALPPTTNFLDIDERLELVRKNQKLARVFGQSPGPDVSTYYLTRHFRGSVSMSNNPDISVHNVFTPTDNGRRHSTPMSSDDFSFFNNSRNSPIKTTVDHNPRSNDPTQRRSASPTSFIDLSDDLGSTHAPFDIPIKAVAISSSPSTQSLFENMSPEEQAEEERKRKRQKLVKLHRFLGSRVPTGLVLGPDVPEVSLPPEITVNSLQEDKDLPRKVWARRRRSSSAAVFPSSWPDDLDRLKEDLNDEEKAINVRRAHKMEKVRSISLHRF